MRMCRYTDIQMVKQGGSHTIFKNHRFYLGLTEKFKNIEAPVKWMRHCIETGVTRKIR
jgi:hypothetical protein